MFETIVNLETKQKGLERNYLEKANADQTIQRTAFLLIKGMVELASLIQGGGRGAAFIFGSNLSMFWLHA